MSANPNNFNDDAKMLGKGKIIYGDGYADPIRKIFIKNNQSDINTNNMHIYHQTTGVPNMNKDQLLQHLQKGYGVQYNEAVEKDNPVEPSPIETELKRDMRRLMFVCIMNLVLILACIIGFVVVASAQVKKVTSEDLITGKMERWIEVTVDSTTFPKKIMRFPMPEVLSGYGTFPSIFKGSSNPVPFKIDTTFMQIPAILASETGMIEGFGPTDTIFTVNKMRTSDIDSINASNGFYLPRATKKKTNKHK